MSSPAAPSQSSSASKPMEARWYKDSDEVRADMPDSIADAEATPPVSLELIDEPWLGDRAIVLHDLFTADECQRAIQYFDACGVTEKCHTRTDYRNNYRVMAVQEFVADVIFKRLQPFLPATQVVDDTTCQYCVNNGAGMYGTWDLDHLNPCFRVCKYDPDGHFGPHYDSDEVTSCDLRSLKTFMIYLNDDYGAGETNFVDDHDLYFDADAKRFKAPATAVRAGLKARRGDALIFDHNILHEGATVRDGYKYIMRCELMYKRRPEDESGLSDEEKAQRQRERNAFEYLRIAQNLEAERREMEAVEYYRKAFKLHPALERL